MVNAILQSTEMHQTNYVQVNSLVCQKLLVNNATNTGCDTDSEMGMSICLVSTNKIPCNKDQSSSNKII